MRDTKTALIIPMYNEETVIKRVVEEALKAFTYVICVDDGSEDNTRQLVAETGAYLLEHPINMGQGAALQTGIEFARLLPVKYFVTYDADGQHRIEDVKAMIKTLKEKRVDFVLGSRFLGKKAVNIPRSKWLVLKLAVWFSNLTSGIKLTDTHNGLRAFNRRVADEIQITIPDMAHASELLEIIARHHYTYTEIPVVITYSDYSLRKGQPLINAINIAFDTLLRKVS